MSTSASSSASSSYIQSFFPLSFDLSFAFSHFLFLLWLGSTADHRPHTPTNYPYLPRFLSEKRYNLPPRKLFDHQIGPIPLIQVCSHAHHKGIDAYCPSLAPFLHLKIFENYV